MKFHIELSKFLTLLLCFLGGFFALSFILTTSVKAQAQTGLSISPLVFELNGDPGNVITNQIKIYNPTEFSVSVKVKVEDFSPVGEEGQVVIEEPDGKNTYSIATWTSVSPQEFTLGAKQQKIITFTIRVPSNAEPGGHYGSIGAITSGGTSEVTGSISNSEVTSLILLRTSGNIKEEILIKDFKTVKPFFEYGPAEFELKFENTGNVHLKPAGFITITDMFGKQVAQIDVPQNNVIPDAVRSANVNWDQKNLIGNYTATLVTNYGSSSKQTITSVTTFFAFPWKKGLIVAVVVLIIIFILRRSRKRISKALQALAGK